MSDFESDYNNYDTARENEGGEQSGRLDPSRGLLLTLAIVLAILVVAGVILALLPW